MTGRLALIDQMVDLMVDHIRKATCVIVIETKTSRQKTQLDTMIISKLKNVYWCAIWFKQGYYI